MLNKNGERELAYVVKIDDIKPIEGADRVELAIVNGWTIMVRVHQFNVGDLAVYFEIDSKVPELPQYAFLAQKHYKVKTQKYFKGTVISQGLLMSAEDFGWNTAIDKAGKPFMIGEHKVGEFLTKELGVTYAEAEDNKRKSNFVDKYKKMAGRHPKLFQNPIIRGIYKTNYGKKFLFAILGNKKDKGTPWPYWVVKTDEERVQNMPYILTNKDPWIATEKIDGTSTTFTMKRGKKRLFGSPKNEFYVCSRNVVFDNPDKPCFYDSNVYLEMARKYNIETTLSAILEVHPEYDWVTLQGETYGVGIQKRDYSLGKAHSMNPTIDEHAFMAFNYITSTEGRWNSEKAATLMKMYGIPWVPIVNKTFILPNTVDELLQIATGTSELDYGMREGLVFRSYDGQKSFKAVSNEYLLKYHG